MKTIIFILLMHSHAGAVSPVSAFESLEQCRQALAVASGNVAADYSCAAVNVAGTWTRKDARYLQPSAIRVDSFVLEAGAKPGAALARSE